MAWHAALKAPKSIKLKVSTNSQLEGEKKRWKGISLEVIEKR